MQRQHAAIGEEAGKRQQADLISCSRWPHQAFHPHQTTDHPVGISVTLQRLQGVAPQRLGPIEGVDQRTRIEVEPYASTPGGPLQLQSGVDLFLTESLGRGDGLLQIQQLGQQPAACRSGLISRGGSPQSPDRWEFQPAATGSGPP